MNKIITNIFKRQMTLLSRVVLKADEQNASNISTMTIGEFVSPQWQYKYFERIQPIRELCPTLEDKERHKDDVAAMKRSLPAGIMSAVVAEGIGEKNVVERNGVIAFDIDSKDNPSLYDWEAVKAAVSKNPFVAYSGLSVTGLGIWGLIPVEDAMKHKEHFDAIADDFANTTFTIMQGHDTIPTIVHGIRIDPAPSNVASKRFVSYDPRPYLNTEAQVYTKTKEPLKQYIRGYTSNYSGKFDIEEFFQKHGIEYTMRKRDGGVQYIVTCPWAPLHSSSSMADSAVFVYHDGKLGYKCLHAHCADKHWHEYREYYEPDAYSYLTYENYI